MFVNWIRKNEVARWLLTVLRVWVGWQWVQSGIEKMNPVWVGDKAGTAISGFLKGSLKLNTGAHPAVQDWYAGFIRSIALPNATLFSYLVAYGELLVGIALILGMFTTFAALLGAVMNASYLFAGTTSANPNMIIEEFFLLAAGYNAAMFGLDYWVIPFVRNLFRRKDDTSNGATRNRFFGNGKTSA